MPAQTDFELTIKRAAGLCLESTTAARSASRRPLPSEHSSLLNTVIADLEGAQDKLFVLSHLPWPEQRPEFVVPPPRPRPQLKLDGMI